MSSPQSSFASKLQGSQGSLGSVDSRPLTEEEKKRFSDAVASAKLKEIASKPKSKYVIIGGKAYARDAFGENISRSRPSILTKSGRKYLDSPNLSETQKSALSVIAGENQATYSIARQFSAERRAQQVAGKTLEEANQLAKTAGPSERLSGSSTSPTQIKFSTADRDLINKTLQTKQIRDNQARLEAAHKLIETQTSGTIDATTGLPLIGPNQLDDIGGILKGVRAEGPIDINRSLQTNITTPRSIALQFSNAAQTGSDITKLNTTLKTSPELASPQAIERAIEEAINNLTGGGALEDTIRTRINPDGSVGVSIPEELSPSIRGQIADSIFQSLGQFFNLRGQRAADFVQDPRGLVIKFDINGDGIPDEIPVGGSDADVTPTIGEPTTPGEEGNIFDQIVTFFTSPIGLIIIIAIVGFILFRAIAGPAKQKILTKPLEAVA